MAKRKNKITKKRARRLMRSGSRKLRAFVRAHAKNRAHRRKKNPVRVAASMSGKSTGKIPAKWVRVTRAKGGKVRVDIGR